MSKMERKIPKNLAIVCLKRAGQRFEIVCNKDKLEEWRNGIEEDPNKVIETTLIFSNYLRGILITDEDLSHAFEHCNREEIFKLILEKEVKSKTKMNRKIGEKDEFSKFLRQLAEEISEITLNSQNGKQFEISDIENAIIQSNFHLKSHKQGPLRHHRQERLKLERQVINLLQQKIPIVYKLIQIEYRLDSKGADIKLKKMEPYFREVVKVKWTPQGHCYLIVKINDMDYRELYELIMDYKRSSPSRINMIWSPEIKLNYSSEISQIFPTPPSQ